MLHRREFLRFKPPPNPAADAYLIHVSRTAMACRFEVTLPAFERSGITTARSALDEAGRLEQQLSVFKHASDISHINRNAAFGPVPVRRSLWALLSLCRTLHLATDAAFDVTAGPLSRCWGFVARQGRVPETDDLEEAKSVVGTGKLSLDREACTVSFQHHGMEINFGSIGKGYALDRMAVLMRNHVRSALLGAGSSSLLAIGAGERWQRGWKAGWKVGLRHPGDKHRRIAVVRLRDCAMSTSGSEEQFFEFEGKRYGHIIDPRSGMPAEGVASASVIASSAAVTDALATAFYVGGVELARRYCESHSDVVAIILESDASAPVVFGRNEKCEVEILSE